MKLSSLIPWLDAHALQIAAVLAALAAAWKAVPVATRTALERRFPRLAGLARFVAAVGPDLLGAARIARYQIAAGQPRPTPFAPPRAIVPPPLPDLRDRSSDGYAATTALLFAVAVAVALALAGCPLPPPDGCAPRSTRCAPDGVPEVCSQTQRWTRGAPSEPCPSGSVCCAAVGAYGRELHACMPAAACAADSGVEGGAR